jgi:RimJ/RimL family protein N-acetyltransferase
LASERGLADFGAYCAPALTTARLVLEPLTAWHGESLFPFLKEPLLYTYIPKEPPLAASHLSRRYEALEQRRSPDGTELWLNWAVRIAAGGYAGLVEATLAADGTAQLAWFVFLPAQQQGFGREAVAAVLDHLATLGAYEAVAFVDTRNAPSLRLAKALGFTRTATHVMREKLRGRWVDDHELRKPLHVNQA